MTTLHAPAGIDARVFSPEAVSEQTAEFNRRVAELIAEAPATHELEPAAVRKVREGGGGWAGPPVRLDHAQERSIRGPGGEIPLRVFVPETVEGVLLHIHGGGWVLGRADMQDPRLWETAQAASVAVVSVDYRLAPEHPYPAGPDDCEAAALWLVEHAQSEFGVERLIIGGESVGGPLSVSTLLRMRDRHGFSGFRAANLVFGVYDLGMTPSLRRAHDAAVLSTATMRWFIDHFVPSRDRSDPEVSPLYAELRDLPPALFTVGTLDPLLDDSLFMHQRWLAAGNASELAVYPGGLHGFTAMPIDIGGDATARINEFIGQAISPDL